MPTVRAAELGVQVQCLQCRHKSILSAQELVRFGVQPEAPIANFMKRPGCQNGPRGTSNVAGLDDILPMSRVIDRTGSINNHRAQSGKPDSAKSRRIAFALFHRFHYPLSDHPADAVRTTRSAKLRTRQVERLIHYSSVAAVKGAFKSMYCCHSQSLVRTRRCPKGIAGRCNKRSQVYRLRGL
jgi:hypothetical protein